MPEVSLIIPVYNVRPYLKRCIASVAAQTFDSLEVIFVDDGSTDGSGQLCMRLIADYPHMRMVCKDNGGLSSARLYGFHNAKGRYVAFVDSDDYIAPDYVKCLYEAIVSDEADISICSYKSEHNGSIRAHNLYFAAHHMVIEEPYVFQKYILPQLPDVYGGNSFLPSFMWLRMFRREIISDDLFVSERRVYQEDLVFAVRSYPRVKRIAVINAPLYCYCVNQGSLTLRYRENVSDMMVNLRNEIVKNTKAHSCEALAYRLAGMQLCATHFILRNASLSDYASFKNQFVEVIKSPDLRDSFKRLNLFKLKRSYMLLVIMLRLRQSFLLYRFNKRRLSASCG